MKQHAAFLLFGLIATLGFTLGLAPGMGATAFAQEAVPAGPITEQREVTDPPAPQAIDLTIPQDDLLARMRAGFAMPNLDSPLVLDRQIWYAARPSAIKHMVERSRRYLYHIVDELEKRGMPTELALLPMVESAFNPMAYSRAHAAGLWQFIPATGKRYDLSQNWWYDGRRDIVAATSAALDYLRDLYQMHGDWHLALASYNWGENAVARAIEKNRKLGLPTDYLSLSMPTETRYYVPKLQALKNIFDNPAAFNLQLDPIPNQPYFVTITKNKDIDLRVAARLAEVPVQELIALNPAHNRPVISNAQSPTLVLPADRADIFLANLAAHDEPLSSWQSYFLRPNDKLDKIAATYGISLALLKQVNGINARTKVGPGLQILVPLKGSAAAAEGLPAIFQPPALPSARTQPAPLTPVRVVHTVKQGETLPVIAQRYRVSVDDLRRWNQIGRLAAGQKLTVMVTPQSPPPAASAAAKPAARKAAKPAAKQAAKPVNKAAASKPAANKASANAGQKGAKKAAN